MKEKDRVALWDNTKFFLIILVVIGHATIWQTESSHIFSSCLLYIYSFHMPLFIFISGMFFSNRNIAQKVVSYLAIYCTYKILLFVVYSFLGRTRSLQLFVEAEAPWFVFTLAVFTLITYCIRNLNLKYVFVVFTILALLAGYDRTLTDKFVLARCIRFYPFYLLGVIISREKIEKQAQNKYCKLAGLIVLIIAALCFWFFKDELYENSSCRSCGRLDCRRPRLSLHCFRPGLPSPLPGMPQSRNPRFRRRIHRYCREYIP